MIILTGESGCGKSTTERLLCEKYGYSRAISHTSREPRKGEVNGVDYIYVSRDEMMRLYDSGELIEYVNYNDNFYGLHKDNIKNDVIAVVEPNGLKQIKQLDGIDVTAIYLHTSEEDRKERMINRGDKMPDILKRLENDKTAFAGVADLADYTLNISKDMSESDVLEAVLGIIDSLEDSSEEDADSEDDEDGSKKKKFSLMPIISIFVLGILLVGFAYLSSGTPVLDNMVFDANSPVSSFNVKNVDTQIEGIDVVCDNNTYKLSFNTDTTDVITIYKDVSDLYPEEANGEPLYAEEYFIAANTICRIKDYMTLDIDILEGSSVNLEPNCKYKLRIDGSVALNEDGSVMNESGKVVPVQLKCTAVN